MQLIISIIFCSRNIHLIKGFWQFCAKLRVCIWNRRYFVYVKDNVALFRQLFEGNTNILQPLPACGWCPCFYKVISFGDKITPCCFSSHLHFLEGREGSQRMQILTGSLTKTKNCVCKSPTIFCICWKSKWVVVWGFR